MKKILSMILTLAMVLSLAVSMGITVSAAPEGTAINNAAEFAAMAADGKYYLAADITLDASYANEFTGTFDGNGKTVTITKVAMFTKVNNATIQNFVVKGDIKATEPGYYVTEGKEDFAAAVALVANGTSTFKNITSDVNYETTSTNTRYGAIAATSEAGHAITIDSCVNNGNVKVEKYAGGIYGWASTLGNSTIKNSINNGDVTMGGYGGGIACRLSNTGEGSALTIDHCTNNGDITSTTSYCAGIVGYNTSLLTATYNVNNGKITATKGATGGIAGGLGKPGTIGEYNVNYNINNGEIVNASGNTGGIVGEFADPGTNVVFNTKFNINAANVTNNGGSNTSGIVGYAYGKGADQSYSIVIGNINTGTIKSDGFVGQMLCYTNSKMTQIVDNLCVGQIVGADDLKAVVVGLSSADITLYTVKGNYYLENDGTKTYSHATADSNAKNRIALADRPADALTYIAADKVASAEVLNALNTATGTTLFVAKDGKPTLNINAGANADAGCKVAAPETTAPVTTAPTQTPATADASFAIVALLAAMTLVVVAASKKRVK